MNPLDWIDYEILGNSVLTWALGLALFVGVWLALVVVRGVARSRLHALAARRKLMPFTIAGHVVDRTKGWFFALIAVLVGSRPWDLDPSVDTWIGRIAMVALLLQGGLWVSAAVSHFIQVRRERELEENPSAAAAMDVLSFITRVAVWSIVLLIMLDNLGVNVTTLIAGLGVGGIAIGLAAQNILGDLFASLSIVLDKPFIVGDFLIIDEHLGSVEKVGIKTTRVRSLSGEQLIFSNNDLLSSRIRNYGRMYERRVVFALGVTYQTPAEKLERIPAIIRKAVEEHDAVRFDRAHFQKYGDFALIFELVYYVLSPDYNRYMDIQQAINLTIYRRFEEEGVQFAYPTQTLFLQRSDAG